MDDPNPRPQPAERLVRSGEVWSQLDANQQDRVIRLLSQMAYDFIAARLEPPAKEKERESVSSHSPPQGTSSTS